MKANIFTRYLCASALILTSCATTGEGNERDALDRSIGQCVAAVAIGAILGAVVDKNRGQGALIGAGVGGVACGVLVAINNEQDKKRVRDAQLAALRGGTNRTDQFVSEKGQTAVVQTSVRDAPTPAKVMTAAFVSPASGSMGPASADAMAAMVSPNTFVGPCRTAQSSISVEGQSAELPSQLFCRTADGDWRPYYGQASA